MFSGQEMMNFLACVSGICVSCGSCKIVSIFDFQVYTCDFPSRLQLFCCFYHRINHIREKEKNVCFVGVVISDPWFQSQFTPVELRGLHSKVNDLNNTSALISLILISALYFLVKIFYAFWF